MTNIPVTARVSVVDRATAPIRRINTAVSRLTAPVRRLGQITRRIGVESGFPIVARQVGGLTRSVGALGGRLRGLLGPLTAIGGIASVAGIGRMITGFANAGDEVAKMADRTGMAVEELQQYQFAADLAGASGTELNDGFRRLNRTLAEVASGRNDQAAELFEQLGIDVRDAEGEIRGLSEVMPELAEGFRLNTNAALRNRMAQVLFGRSSEGIINLLAQGEESLRGYLDEALRYGILTEEQARQAEELTDSQSRLGAAWEGVTNLIGASLSSVFQPLIERLTEWLVINRELIASRVHEVVEDLVDRIQAVDWRRVVQNFQAFGGTIADLVERVGGLGNALIGLIVLMNMPLIAAIANVARALIGLGVAMLTTPVGWFLGAIALIAAAAWWLIDDWDPIMRFFADLWESVKAIFRGFGAFLAGVFTGDTERMVAGLQEIWEGYKDFFSTLFRPIRAIFRGFVAWVDNTFATDMAGSIERIQENWEGFKDNLREVWRQIVAIFEWAWDQIRPIIDSIHGAIDTVVEGVRTMTQHLEEIRPDVRMHEVPGVRRGMPFIDQDEDRPQLSPFEPRGDPMRLQSTPGVSRNPADYRDRQSGRLRVIFDNLPQGARVDTRDLPEDTDVDVGHSMSFSR